MLSCLLSLAFIIDWRVVHCEQVGLEVLKVSLNSFKKNLTIRQVDFVVTAVGPDFGQDVLELFQDVVSVMEFHKHEL